MIVKVKYEETVSREAQVEIDEDEFLEYANESYSKKYATALEACTEEPGLLKEFLEEGDTDVWAQNGDPSGMSYDQTLVEVSP